MKFDRFGGKTPEEILRSNLQPRELLSFEELTKYHSSGKNLPRTLKRRMRRYADTNGYYTDYANAQSDLHFAYQCWALVDSGDADAVNVFGHTLDNFNSFVANYVPNVTPSGRENIFRMTGYFRNQKAHPSRLLEIYPPDTGGASEWVPDIYGGKGSWVHLPYEDRVRHFIEKSALEEVIRDPDLRRGFYAFHSTNTSALSGIEKHKAILSSHEALKRGQEVTSGEHVFYSKGWAPKGLGNVYAKSGLIKAYGIPSWFSDVPLTFRINLEGLNYYRKETGGKSISYRDDIGGEGITMGREIPLRFVDAVYSYFIDLHRIKPWVERVCPDASVYTYEGAEVISDLRRNRKGYDYLSNSQFVQPDKAIVI